MVVLDVADFPEAMGPLLIDEFFLRATDGPLRDDSGTREQIDLVLGEIGDPVVFDSRREYVYDRATAWIMAGLVPLFGLATLLIAFGRPRKWRTDQGLAPPATPLGPGLPPPEPPRSSE